MTAYQKFKLLPKGERDAILAAKAARKAAKNQRKNERRKIASSLPKKPKKTPQEIFNENPNAVWEKVVYALRNAIMELEWLYKVFDKYKEPILSITSSDHVSDIDTAIDNLNSIEVSYKSAITEPIRANDFLETALAFQAKFGTVSEYAEKCQPVPLPEQGRLNVILQFYTSQKVRLVTCEKEATEMARQNAPAEFVECFIGMLSWTSELNNLILCVIIKLLFGRIEFVKPTCETAIDVRCHLHVQDLNQRNVDGSIAAQARNCADNTGCLDCTGVQAWNIVRHHGYMYDRAIKKMLISLLNGRETALEAFWKFLEMECEHKFNHDPRLFRRYSSLINMFIPQFHHKKRHSHDFQRFSEEQRGEIAKMILRRCDMTIEEVESCITTFLSTQTSD